MKENEKEQQKKTKDEVNCTRGGNGMHNIAQTTVTRDPLLPRRRDRGIDPLFFVFLSSVLPYLHLMLLNCFPAPFS